MPVVRDWGTAIMSALGNALNMLLTFVPRFIGFLVILLIGWIIAALVSKALVALLRKVGFDRLSDRIGFTRFEQQMGIRMDPAQLLGKIVFWILFLIFLVPATDALGLPAVSSVINRIVDYLPNVFVAILVLFLGALAATVVADLVRGITANTSIGNPNVFATVARVAVLGFSILIALEQLQIAPALLNLLFAGIIGAAALAFGLAFGIGGRDAAQRLLNRSEEGMSRSGSAYGTQLSTSPGSLANGAQTNEQWAPPPQTPTQTRRAR